MMCGYCGRDGARYRDGDHTECHPACQAEASARISEGMCEACGKKEVKYGDWCAGCEKKYSETGKAPYQNFPGGQ